MCSYKKWANRWDETFSYEHTQMSQPLQGGIEFSLISFFLDVK